MAATAAVHKSFGLGTALYDPEDANVDIVFVHGLSGDRVRTWTSMPTDDIPTPTYWPKDLLPAACPSSRILSFGYKSQFFDFFCGSERKNLPVETTIDDHSSALLLSLINFRDQTQTPLERPVIFVCHSMGGLVVANALARQHGSNMAAQDLVTKTAGLVFLGTPFGGSEKARWGNIGLAFAKIIGGGYNGKLRELDERSGKLININDSFYKYMKMRDTSDSPIQTICFFEEKDTFVKNINVGLIVPRQSAMLRGIDLVPIAGSHSGMCKFSDDLVPGYKDVSGFLRRLIKALDKSGAGGGEGTHPSVYQERTVFYGEISGNEGIIMGNVYGNTPNSNHITGRIVNNYNGTPPPRED